MAETGASRRNWRFRLAYLAAMGLAAAPFNCGSDSTGASPAPSQGDGGLEDTDAPVANDGASAGDTATSSEAASEAAADAGPPPTPVNVDHACSSTLRLQASLFDEGVARFHYVVGGAPQADRGWTYDLSQFAGPRGAVVQDGPTTLHLQTSAIDVQIAGVACSISIRSVATGEVLWSESAPFTQASDGSVSLGRGLVSGEAIYGLGEKTGDANRVGRAFTMWNTDQGSPSGDPIYQSHPFFLSLPSSGHTTGAYLANTNRSTFDVGAASATSLAMGAVAGDIDLFFFDGPQPPAVLEEYTRLVGRPFLPPLWSLGYHQCRWTYTPESYFEQIATQFRQLNLPIDGMWLDINYMDGFRDFTWDPNAFPDPMGMVSSLTNRGFKITTIVDPGVKYDPGGSYATYNDGANKGAFIADDAGRPVQANVWPGAAVFPDFTDPMVRTWWSGQAANFLNVGIRGIWNDMNEPSTFSSFPMDVTVHGEGKPTTFTEAKNVYALLEASAAQQGELTAFPNQRPFLLTRAGFSGIQKYSAVWTGDSHSTWDFLIGQVPMLQGLSASGVPFVGSDVGGYSGGPSPELYGRWFELGTFSPFFRTHSQTGSPPQEPWQFGSEILYLAQQMLSVRYALLPYWQESFAQASASGAPVMRPLWFQYPADLETQRHTNEWFVGDSLLVATVTAPLVTQLEVYVPAGVFHDFYTGAAYTGPTTVTLPAPLGRIPILVRGGSVIPEMDVENYVGEHPDVARHLDVYPGGAGTSTTQTLHEDDGESLDYVRGGQSTVAVSLDVSATGLTLSLGARSGGYTPPAATSRDVRIHGVTAQPAVTVNGATAPATWSERTRLLVVPVADYASAQTVVATYPLATLPPVRQVSLAFSVALPASTPAGATVYVASSAGGWAASGQALATSGGVATGNLTVPEGTLVWFLMTLGDWSTVELSASCTAIADRNIVASYGTNGTMPVSIVVGAWGNHCPGEASTVTAYTFETLVDPGTCMDVTGAGTADGTPLEEWTCNVTSSQLFNVVDAGNGAVNLVNTNAGKCVDIGTGTANGTRAQLSACQSTPGQAFVLKDAGGGLVNLVNQGTSKCLDVDHAMTAPGTAVQLYDCNQTNAQEWRPSPLAFQPVKGQ